MTRLRYEEEIRTKNVPIPFGNHDSCCLTGWPVPNGRIKWILVLNVRFA